MTRLVLQDAGFAGGSQVIFGELMEGCVDGLGPCHHHDVPAGLEQILVKTVYLPQSSAGPVAHMCLTQLFADGNAHPIGGGAVLAGIEYQTGVCLSAGAVKPLNPFVTNIPRFSYFKNAAPIIPASFASSALLITVLLIIP